MAAGQHGRKMGLAVVIGDPPGTDGPDLYDLFGGPHEIHAGAGDDTILARRVAPSILDGGDGNDLIRLVKSDPGSLVLGGAGDDLLRIRAALTHVDGGAGDDRYVVDGLTAGGSVIVDAEGANRLRVDNAPGLAYHHEAGGDDLQIILGAGGFDPTRDIVWKDFFANPLNQVNGLTTAEVAALAPVQGEPLALGPTVAEMIYAADSAYSRAETGLPGGLTPFLVGGVPLELQVTEAGFFGRALLTADHEVIVAFEGTAISQYSAMPDFVTAQIVADALIYLGLVPPAFTIAASFTEAVLLAAAGAGIDADHVFVTGHSLGAGIAMYVGADLDLAGMTFAAPGIAASAIPAGQPSKLVNYVGYGDPVGNYAANPPTEGPFLHSPDILRYGSAEYLGDPLAGLALAADTAIFGPGHTEEEMSAALLGLAALAATYHPLHVYAQDLGYSIPAGTDLDLATLNALLPVIVAALEAAGITVPEPGIA